MLTVIAAAKATLESGIRLLRGPTGSKLQVLEVSWRLVHLGIVRLAKPPLDSWGATLLHNSFIAMWNA